MSVTIDSKSQRFTSGVQPEADVCVLHTTEGMSWPGYSGGGEAPHATIRALPGSGITVREHIPTGQYAKALMNLPGGVETNRRGVLQYELVGTCDPSHRGDKRWYFWPEADPVVLAALAGYLRPILARYKIPHAAPTFKAYPSSYGANGVRMSGATWNAFNGICGHEHVPENDHGDPGAFPAAELIALLKGVAAPTTTQTLEAFMADLVMTNPLSHVPTPAAAGLNSVWAYVVMTHTLLKSVATKTGVDVDEKALAAALVASLAPTLRTAVTAAVTAGGTPEAVADAVVAKLAASLGS